MSAYQRILLAVDFSPGTEYLCQRASEVAGSYQAELTMLHVVEPLLVEPAYDVLPAIPVELEADVEAHSRKELMKLGDRFGVPPDRCWVETGSTKLEIIEKAKTEAVELIIVGRHGHSGVGWLLGSTANAVLHGAPCDVLAVRIPEKEDA